MLTIPSTRFGSLQVAEEAVIAFPCGLIGLPGHRFARVAPDLDSPFGWLHSVEHARIAIPVTDPRRWFRDVTLALSEGDAARVGSTGGASAEILVTVRVDGKAATLVANLRAPIVIHRAIGHQVINHARGASLQAVLPTTSRAAA